MEKVTIDSIIGTLIEWTENKVPISPDRWIDAALKLNLLKGELSERLITTDQVIAQEKYTKIVEGKSVAHAKSWIETTETYAIRQKMHARIEQIEEMVRLAKVRGKMGMEDYKSQ